MTSLNCPELPEDCLVVLIGTSGAGKTTLAATWPASQVLSLDAMRETVSDDAGNQEATPDAVDLLHLALDRRMARGKFTIVDATNVTAEARAPLVAAAKRHNIRVIAIVVATPESVCVERQRPRPANRTVRDDTISWQHKAMVHSYSRLQAEGFDEVVFADTLFRLLPFLKTLSEKRVADLGLDGGGGLGELLLVQRVFGPEILPLWRWKPGSTIADGDGVAEIRLGQMSLTLALRPNGDGKGDYGFDIQMPCPHDDECTSSAWVPAYSITCLYRALKGDLDDSEDIVCTVHGPNIDDDQDDDPEGRADLAAQSADAVRA